MRNPRITQHAIQRFIERVDATASPAQAAARIAAMLESGRTRPNPRRWSGARPQPGTMFVYCCSEPEACLLATRDAVVTVVSRDLCAASRRQRELSAYAPVRSFRGHPRPGAYRRTMAEVAA